MIPFNEIYNINGGKATIEFEQNSDGSVTGKYKYTKGGSEGIVTGKPNGTILEASFVNTTTNSKGLMHFVFTENGFDCKWKDGVESGEMKNIWKGTLSGNNNKEVDNNSDSIFLTLALEIEDNVNFEIAQPWYEGPGPFEINIPESHRLKIKEAIHSKNIETIFNELMRGDIKNLIAESIIDSLEKFNKEDTKINIWKVNDLDFSPIWNVVNDVASEHNKEGAKRMIALESAISDFRSETYQRL